MPTLRAYTKPSNCGNGDGCCTEQRAMCRTVPPLVRPINAVNCSVVRIQHSSLGYTPLAAMSNCTPAGGQVRGHRVCACFDPLSSRIYSKRGDSLKVVLSIPAHSTLSTSSTRHSSPHQSRRTTLLALVVAPLLYIERSFYACMDEVRILCC
jgi:hypothetical protein